MEQGGIKVKEKIKALILLSRLSNLPTIWSNCLAGWLLGGGGDVGVLLNLCFGVSCIYIAAMFMNDICDIDYDSIYRPERPIPAGILKEQTVWIITVALFALGLISTSHISKNVMFLSGLLLLLVLIYNLTHKIIKFSTLVVGLCRLILYLLGASIAARGFSGLVLWSAVVLCLYIWGISWIARYESRPEIASQWGVVFLFCPIGLALVVNDGEYRTRGLICAFFVFLWIFSSIRRLNFEDKEIIKKSVSQLLAGIILIDLLAVIGVSTTLATYIIIFPALFILALILQKFIPAT